MTECARCHRSAGPTDRYCTRCGSLLSDTGPAGDLASHDSQLATSDRISWGDGRRRWLMGLGIVSVVAVAAWVALRAGPDDAGPAGAGADTPTTVSVPRSPSTTLLVGGLSGSGIAAMDDVTGLVGGESGLHLYVGHDEGVIDLDLDRGTQTRLPVVGRPVALVGRWLVAVHPVTGLAAAVELDTGAVTDVAGLRALPVSPQPGPQARGPAVGRLGSIEEPGSDSGGSPESMVWLLAVADDGRTGWALVDLGSGEVVDTVAALSSPPAYPPGPEVTTSSAGGVYVRSGPVYKRAVDGVLVALGPDRALVRTCTSPTTCELSWFDAATWAAVDAPVPSIPIDDHGAVVSADGSLLAFTSTDGGLHLFDTATAERHLVPGGAHPVTLTADGSFAATPGPTGVLLYAIADGRAVTVDLTEPPERGILLGRPGGDG